MLEWLKELKEAGEVDSLGASATSLLRNAHGSR
jgi:hypothetical protein